MGLGLLLVAGGTALALIGLIVLARREDLGEWIARMKADYRWFVGEPAAVPLFGSVILLNGVGWVVAGIISVVRGL